MENPTVMGFASFNLGTREYIVVPNIATASTTHIFFRKCTYLVIIIILLLLIFSVQNFGT